PVALLVTGADCPEGFGHFAKGIGGFGCAGHGEGCGIQDAGFGRLASLTRSPQSALRFSIRASGWFVQVWPVSSRCWDLTQIRLLNAELVALAQPVRRSKFSIRERTQHRKRFNRGGTDGHHDG